MRADEYIRFDALGLATLIGSGEVSADEVMAAARSQIAECNPLLNAIIELYDSSERFPGSRGPFAGVPFLLKDIGQESRDAGRVLAAELFMMHRRSAMTMN
jgi:amidase